MKVLIVTQYFYPENFKSNDIAFELSARGYDVTVLTGIPNYPRGKYYDGYGIFSKRRENIQGVKIIRAFLFPRGKGGGARLGLNYFSWAFFASIRAFFLALSNKYDAIIVHEPSPITQGFPAIVIKKIQKTPIYFWVLDLWPESLISAGGVENKRVITFFTHIVKHIYKHSDKLLISSKSFKESILEKGDFKDKIIYFPNWAEDVFNTNTRQDIPELPEGFKVMFAGNIGEAQDFEHVMEAALYLKEFTDIKFILLGEGRKKDWVQEFIYKHELQHTVYLMGSFPLQYMPSFFNQADVMFLTLKDELIFNLTVPAKLQSYMAAGKPVVAMLNGEGSKIIKESGCGFSVKAGFSRDFADKIIEMYRMDPTTLEKMGLDGKEYFKRHYNKDMCIDNLCRIIKPEK